MSRIECGHIYADVYYDTTDPKNTGWYALYSHSYGPGAESRMLTDSMKIGHPKMPRRRDAHKKAERIAHAYACKLDRSRRKGTLYK